MSDPTTSEPADAPTGDDLTGDEMRQHSQDPAEGADPDVDEGPPVPREHTQDPAEG